MAKLNFRTIQFLLWVLTYLVVFFYCYYKFESLAMTIVYSVIVSTIYLLTVYGNSHFLIPRYFRKNKFQYFVYAILFMAAVTAIRMWLENWIFFGLMEYKWFFNFQSEHFSFSAATIIFAFLFGALLRISLDHFSLLHREQERKNQQVAAELNLLKSQVQPHFLFNALNNIYYLAYMKSDLAPESIARLSDIMRYFVEEATKEWVSVQAELDFIKDYIEVERIRLPHNLKIQWTYAGDVGEQLIPPIVFIPLVENAFKHGVDKVKENNEVQIGVEVNKNELTFTVRNLIHHNNGHGNPGTGLANLRKRLTLLYEDNFTLTTTQQVDHYIAQLSIPL
ncbi:MAG TPA: histidine kinase [Chryseolinea sp.]|nr:histidine kinase [Chryseolinea sp.]